jgi:hypothetical protein
MKQAISGAVTNRKGGSENDGQNRSKNGTQKPPKNGLQLPETLKYTQELAQDRAKGTNPPCRGSSILYNSLNFPVARSLITSSSILCVPKFQ